MKTINIPDELHKCIKVYCVNQSIVMKDFVIGLIDKGWQVEKTMNGDTINTIDIDISAASKKPVK